MLDEAASPPAETMAERHGRLLGRLAELSLAACEDLAARALAAEEPKLAADLHGAFAKAGRCLRQTVMLEARLAKAAAEPQRPTAAPVRPAPAFPAAAFTPRPAPDPRDARQAYLAEGLAEEICEQLEGAERDERLDRLDDLLDVERGKPRFLTEPVAAVALRICEGLGITFGARPVSPESGLARSDGPEDPEPDPPPEPEPEPEPSPDPPPDPEPDPAPEPPPVYYTYPWDHPRARYGGHHGDSGW